MTRYGAPLLAALVLGATLPRPATAQDDSRATPLFHAERPMAEVLATARVKDKALVVVLSNGATYTGKIKSVGAHAVILTGLQGKEFFDAYIPIEHIVAMEERVRLR